MIRKNVKELFHCCGVFVHPEQQDIPNKTTFGWLWVFYVADNQFENTCANICETTAVSVCLKSTTPSIHLTGSDTVHDLCMFHLIQNNQHEKPASVKVNAVFHNTQVRLGQTAARENVVLIWQGYNWTHLKSQGMRREYGLTLGHAHTPPVYAHTRTSFWVGLFTWPSVWAVTCETHWHGYACREGTHSASSDSEKDPLFIAEWTKQIITLFTLVYNWRGVITCTSCWGVRLLKSTELTWMGYICILRYFLLI